MTDKTYTFSKKVTTTYEVEMSKKLLDLLCNCNIITCDTLGKEGNESTTWKFHLSTNLTLLRLIHTVLENVCAYELSVELDDIIDYIDENYSIDNLEYIGEY